MATAPDTPTITVASSSYSVHIDYGLTSFGDPATGTLKLYKGTPGFGSTLATQTAVGDYTFTHSTNVWANEEHSYYVVANNGELSSSNVTATTVTLPPNFSISGNVIESSNIGKNSFDVRWHPAALGSKYQVDLYASIDGKQTWVLVAQGIQNGTDYTYTFTGLSPGTTYTVYTQARDSIGRSVDVASSSRIPVVTTLSDPKLYGSVNNNTKKVAKLYGSVAGATKLIKKLYGSVNGETKLIYEDTNA